MIARFVSFVGALAFLGGCYCSRYASSGCLTPEEIRGKHSDTSQLVEWMEKDERGWVREEAARTLGEAQAENARPALEAKVIDRRERGYVRAAAAEALGQIADAASMPVLSGLSSDPSTPPELEIAVILALCRFSGPEPLQAIAPLGKHNDLLVSAVAANSLASNCGRGDAK